MDENPYKSPEPFGDVQDRPPNSLSADFAFAAVLCMGFCIAFAAVALGSSVLNNSGLSILSGTIAGATTVLALVRWTNRHEGQL
jgi:hypothetical protein